MHEKPLAFKRDDLHLAGVLHLPDKRSAAFPIVLMLHGLTGNRCETHFVYTQLSRRLARAGIASFRFDFAGSGDSEGDFADVTILTELEDARAAVRFLEQQPELDMEQFGLVGFSAGGLVAALLAPEVESLKAWSIWAAVAEPIETFSELLSGTIAIDWQGRRIHDLGGLPIGTQFMEVLPAVQPLDLVSAVQAPCLIVHGEHDQVVPLSAAYKYFEVLRHNNGASRLEVIAEGDHAFSSMEKIGRVSDLTFDWFSQRLLPAAAHSG